VNAVVGTGGLIRLILRRDRFLLPIWVLLALMPLMIASATAELFPTPEGLREYYASITASPALTSTIGPVFGSSLGALAAWRSGIVVVFIALISLLTVVRHTRMEEETGRRELLGATVLGRQAPLAAALVVACCASLALGTITAVAMIGYGLPVAGSVALGLSYAADGWLFAAVGGVAAQLTQGAGAARGVALSTLGALFLVRAAGDAGGEDSSLAWLSWLSPIGWVHRVRPYASERWWLLAPVVGLAVVLAAVAAVVLARRDVGAGALPQRLGRARAGAGLQGAFGLAWRLHRGLLLGWSAGFMVIGLVIGGATESIDRLVEGSSQLADMLSRIGGAAALRDMYLTAVLGMLAVAVSGYAIQATLRLRVEESAQRAEPVLATAVTRPRWLASHLGFAFAGPAVVLAAHGAFTGLAVGVVTGDAAAVPRLVGAALVRLPAVWVLVGLAVAAYGLLPRVAAAVSWSALGLCTFIVFIGSLLQLDQWIMDVAPFTHVPNLPGGDLTVAPLAWLLAVAVVLTAAGVAGFRRRDISSDA